MADDEHFSSDPFRRKSPLPYESDNSDVEEPVRLDLGIDQSRTYERINETEGAAGTSSGEVPRREDNPFSFKHFLRNSTTNYQSQGARPKVYCDGRPISSISDLDLNKDPPAVKQTRIVPEFSSALPDFVQDHLVIEQCYLDKENSENGFNISSSNLPDFTPHRNYNRLNGEPNHGSRIDNDLNNMALPLDLPVRPVIGFPLDLPIIDSNCSGTKNGPSSSEVGASKSLPDFLTDGAVRTQTSDENLPGFSNESEIDRLRHSVELYQHQLREQIRCTEQLRRQLDVARSKEVEYTHKLSKALEQVELNLENSNLRAVTAEESVTKLKLEIKSLKSKTKLLQQENDQLRQDQGASGGPSRTRFDEVQTRRLAQDLRISASSAEQSLRQLLLGVESLRLMASAIENVNRVEERDESFSDFEDGTGPAL